MGGLIGCHYIDELNKLCIHYEATDWLGRNEFTIVHECYEAIQETFEKIVPGYQAQRDPSSLCMRPYADRFAAAVLMQPDVFTAAMMATGLDICSLRRYFNFYSRSYSSVAIRIRELLRPPLVDADVDFLIAIYDRQSDREPHLWSFDCCYDDFCAHCVARLQEFD